MCSLNNTISNIKNKIYMLVSSAIAQKVAVSREFEARLRHAATVVVVLLCYIHGKHLRSYRDGQLT